MEAQERKIIPKVSEFFQNSKLVKSNPTSTGSNENMTDKNKEIGHHQASEAKETKNAFKGSKSQINLLRKRKSTGPNLPITIKKESNTNAKVITEKVESDNAAKLKSYSTQMIKHKNPMVVLSNMEAEKYFAEFKNKSQLPKKKMPLRSSQLENNLQNSNSAFTIKEDAGSSICSNSDKNCHLKGKKSPARKRRKIINKNSTNDLSLNDEYSSSTKSKSVCHKKDDNSKMNIKSNKKGSPRKRTIIVHKLEELDDESAEFHDASFDVHSEDVDMPVIFESSSKISKRQKNKLGMEVKDELIKKVNNQSLNKKNDKSATGTRSAPPKKRTLRTGRRFSVTGNWYIASGYLSDIINLLEQFEAIDSWRFKDFATCWKNNCFSLVYRGRQTFKELLEFSEEISLLTMRFIGPSHPTKKRIGALYTLYGLYYKFPVGHFFSLRFELPEYKNLLELVRPFRSNKENPDPAYVFRKLELKGAIHHCATSDEPCYDFHSDGRDFVDLEYGKQKLAKSSAVSNAISNQQLENNLQLLNHYHTSKTLLTGSIEDSEPDKALMMVKPEFLKTVSSELKNLRSETLKELGMIPNETIDGDDSQVGADINADAIEGENDVINYVSDEVLKTINNGRCALNAQLAIENNNILKDKKVQNFMKYPTPESLIRPLTLTDKRKRSTHSECDLSLTDINNFKKVSRVNLTVRDEDSEMLQSLEPQLPPIKKRLAPKRAHAIIKAVTEIPVVSDKKYNPCHTKSLIEKSTENRSSKKCSSATKLSSIKKENETIEVIAKLSSGLEMKDLQIKVEVTAEEAKEFKTDSNKLRTLKKKLEPKVSEKLSGIDKLKVWLIDDVVPTTINNPSFTSKEMKSKSFKQRFTYLREEPEEIDKESVASYSSLNSDEEKDHKIDLCDDDYIPEVIEQKEVKTRDEVDDEMMTDNSYSSHSEDENHYPRHHRKGKWSNYTERILPLDSDKLLQPSTSTKGVVKMTKVIVGGKVKYFPQYEDANVTSEEPDETIDLPMGHVKFEGSTWNDYSSAEAPPLIKKNHPHNKKKEYYVITPSRETCRPLKTTAQIKDRFDCSSDQELDDDVASIIQKRRPQSQPIVEHSSCKKAAIDKASDESLYAKPVSVKNEVDLSIADLADDWNEEPANVEENSSPEEDSEVEEQDSQVDFNATSSASNQPTPSASNQPTPSASNQPTPSASNQPTPSASIKPTPSASNKPTPSAQILNASEIVPVHPNLMYFIIADDKQHSVTTDTSHVPVVAKQLNTLRLQNNDVVQTKKSEQINFLIESRPYMNIINSVPLLQTEDSQLVNNTLQSTAIKQPEEALQLSSDIILMDTIGLNSPTTVALPNSFISSSQKASNYHTVHKTPPSHQLKFNSELLRHSTPMTLAQKLRYNTGVPGSSVSRLQSLQSESLPRLHLKPSTYNVDNEISSCVKVSVKSTSTAISPQQTATDVISFPITELSSSSTASTSTASCNKIDKIVKPSRLSCSFVFSPKLKTVSKKTATIASGKPPEIKKKNVKFLMKGMFKSFRKS